MSLEDKSKEIKKLMSTYDTQWILGDLSSLIQDIAAGRAQDQLGNLSSPLRQLYFLGGLLVTSDESKANDFQYTHEKWNEIVSLLNDIEQEYDKLFFPKPDEEIDEEWRHIRKVAVPSFLSYFNQGPLNYEEQIINWVSDLYLKLDDIVESELGLKTAHFIQFYHKLDELVQKKFQGFGSNPELFEKEWLDFTKIEMGVSDEAPDFIREMGEKNRPLYTFMSDRGIIKRFKPEDINGNDLTLERVQTILDLLTCKRQQSDFLYYTSTNPGNPLYEQPIVDIGNGLYQVFEVKQVIHAIDNLLENICNSSIKYTTKYVEKKGKYLEESIVKLFSKFLKRDFEVYTSYYIDGCEQDILILWRNYAFIVEAKAYNLNEPFRDPNKAFQRIKKDFKKSIGYAFEQTRRVAKKFVDQIPLKIEDKNGNVIKEIDTSKYEGNDFSIIVNQKSFGQIQNDLSILLEIAEDSAYPWVVKFDDLEVFILTLIALKKTPAHFIDFLLMREELHGKILCSDELEICGGFLQNKINQRKVEQEDLIETTNDLTIIFDDQYLKGMGFENEKNLDKKKSGNYIFW